MFDEFQQGVRDLAKRPALSAMLGFRMIYYVFPFILSLPFFFALRHRRG